MVYQIQIAKLKSSPAIWGMTSKHVHLLDNIMQFEMFALLSGSL